MSVKHVMVFKDRDPFRRGMDAGLSGHPLPRRAHVEAVHARLNGWGAVQEERRAEGFRGG